MLNLLAEEQNGKGSERGGKKVRSELSPWMINGPGL